MSSDSLDNFDVLSDDILIEEVGDHIQANLQDEIVRDALKSGVDLRDYSERIKSELINVENLSIDDYVKSRDKVIELHKQIISSDAILKRMEEILFTFHKDLGSISTDIQSLQTKSLHMHQCLQNRQIVRGELCQFMAEMVVPEQMINHILETPVTERHFLEQLHELDHKLKFVKEQSFKDAKSAQDVSEILEQLKIKAIMKIREYLLQKIYSFRKPMTNFQVPQDMMLKYRFFNEFLLANDRAVSNEISREYVDTTSKIHYSYFKAYITKLTKLQFDRNADKEDFLGKEDLNSFRRNNSTSSSIFLQSSLSSSNLKNKSTVFSLAQRDSILYSNALEAPIILPHTIIANQKSENKIGAVTKFTYETLFRSEHYALLDNCCREYLFLCDFFILSPQAGQDFFNQVMGKTLNIFQKQMETSIAACFDAIAILICIRIVLWYRDLCSERGVPALENYWGLLLNLLWPRWFELMDNHISSVRTHATTRSSNSSNTQIDFRPYCVTRKYAEFCAALHTILRRQIETANSISGMGVNSLPVNNGVIPAIDSGMKSVNMDAKIASRLMRMQVEIEAMLMRLTDYLQNRKEKLIFFINNCDLILSVLTECEVADCIEGLKFKDLMSDKINEFVEEVLLPYFGSFINFIKETESNQNKNAKTEYSQNEEAKVQKIIKGFNIDWKTSIEKINSEILTSFSNFCIGTQIFQAVLSQLIQYYRRLQACMNLSPYKNMPVKNELVNIHLIMVEMKKFQLTPQIVDQQYLPSSPSLQYYVPLASIPLFVTESSNYKKIVEIVQNSLNDRYSEFMRSEEGQHFDGHISIIADAIGSIFVYDILTKCQNDSRPSLTSSSNSQKESIEMKSLNFDSSHRESDPISLKSEQCSTPDVYSALKFKLDFKVHQFFMLGSPVGLVQLFRNQTIKSDDGTGAVKDLTSETIKKLSTNELNELNFRPNCRQLYNLFHLNDPSSYRIEPLINQRFHAVPPMKISHYNRFPHGNDDSTYLVETLFNNPGVVENSAGLFPDETTFSEHDSNLSAFLKCDEVKRVINSWWGEKRIDYGLHCPDGVQAFPLGALPHLLHASYWESKDCAAFIIRQIIDASIQNQDFANEIAADLESLHINSIVEPFTIDKNDKIKSKQSSLKFKNMTANHRANDVMVLSGQPQILSARFMYGTFDMLTPKNQKVDVYIMNLPISHGHWEKEGNEVTDSTGRVSFHIAESRRMPEGVYPIRMVLGADSSVVQFHLAVLPLNVEVVVFSIDGSFAASVSISGKDPKVRPGSIDVARFWQDKGYLLIYISARPNMQQRHVQRWLAQHKFPFGMILFSDGVSAEPLKQKLQILAKLIKEVQIKIHCAYGSSKDISIYRSLGLHSHQIFTLGRLSRHKKSNSFPLKDGYAAHLNDLLRKDNSLSKPSRCISNVTLRRSCFDIPIKYISGNKNVDNNSEHSYLG